MLSLISLWKCLRMSCIHCHKIIPSLHMVYLALSTPEKILSWKNCCHISRSTPPHHPWQLKLIFVSSFNLQYFPPCQVAMNIKTYIMITLRKENTNLVGGVRYKQLIHIFWWPSHLHTVRSTSNANACSRIQLPMVQYKINKCIGNDRWFILACKWHILFSPWHHSILAFTNDYWQIFGEQPKQDDKYKCDL